jgi:hypothetical protein
MLPDGIKVEMPVEVVASGVGVVAAEIATTAVNLGDSCHWIRLAVGNKALDVDQVRVMKSFRISSQAVVVKQQPI